MSKCSVFRTLKSNAAVLDLVLPEVSDLRGRRRPATAASERQRVREGRRLSVSLVLQRTRSLPAATDVPLSRESGNYPRFSYVNLTAASPPFGGIRAPFSSASPSCRARAVSCQRSTAQALAAKPTDLDAFMARALQRRDIDRKTLSDYVLDEVEEFEVLGPGRVPFARMRREYTWYVRDGIHVRSPAQVRRRADPRGRPPRLRGSLGQERRRAAASTAPSATRSAQPRASRRP